MAIEFKDNHLGIIVIPKNGEKVCYQLWLDNDDAATLNAPKNMDAFESFQNAKSLRKLFEFLDDCFYIDDEVYRDGDMVPVHWTLKKLVEFNDYENEFPKFKKKVNALKTLDQIASITVFTANYELDRRDTVYRYEWVKYDLEAGTVKSGTDKSIVVDEDERIYEPSEEEMFRIMADK